MRLRARRGLRAGHVREGFPGTREVSSFPSEREPQFGQRLQRARGRREKRCDPSGAKHRRMDGTAKRRRTKRGGMDDEKSEHLIVPRKRGNGADQTPWREADAVSIEPLEGKMTDTPRSESISTKRQRIAELARQAPEMSFTNLAHHIDIEWLHAAYRATRKDGAVGLDGQTAVEYAAHLEENLESLLNDFKSGRYRAPAVRRVHIPKGERGKTRPIGIPTFEDKVLQRAVAMVLECVYEQDFLDCSYGFRPGRSAHQALEAIRRQAMSMRGGWVVDLDIQGFFDALDHGHLRAILDQRVRDGVLRRAVGKWLKAGVVEEGSWKRSEAGTPQGGVVSPILANVYLHHVLDKWFATEVRPRLCGRSFMVRYADDVVIVVEQEADAQRVMGVLPKRLARFGLTMHPTKSRLIRFRPPSNQSEDGNDDDDASPGAFDFLGFTHYWGRTRKGGWAIKRKTAKDRFRRSVSAIYQWCRWARHQPIAKQHRMLIRKLEGHRSYYGLSGNSRALQVFRYRALQAWQKWLNERSQKPSMPRYRFWKLLGRYPVPLLKLIPSANRA